MTDYNTYADKVFNSLKTVFQGNDNYWQLGYSFEIIMSYFEKVTPSAAAGFVDIALDRYNNTGGCWFDDFGWWSVASAKASQLPKLFGADACATFAKNAYYCWHVMEQYATAVWHNGRAKYPQYQPLCDGGVWNCDWISMQSPQKDHGCNHVPAQPHLASDCKDPDNPTDIDNLGGIQNTVTNALYFLSSARLYNQKQPNVPITASQNEANFLTYWLNINNTLPAGVTPLLKSLSSTSISIPGQSVVLERVSCFDKNSQGQYPVVCGFNPDVAWSGDQGLMLGGLVDYMVIVKSNPQQYNMYLQLAQSILSGVQSLAASQNYLPYWLLQDGGDPPDYTTGTGVYMSYVLYAYINNTDLQNYMNKNNYSAFIKKNADYVVQQLQSTMPTDLVTLTNYLAVLVAASVMCSSQVTHVKAENVI